MTGYWAVNSTADDGRLAICPLCVWAPATLAWFEIGLFWERPSKSSSGTERDSTTTSSHSIWSAEMLKQCTCLLWGLDVLKWQFSRTLSVTAEQAADNHNQNVVGAGESFLQGQWESISWLKMWYQFWNSYLCTSLALFMSPLQSPPRECRVLGKDRASSEEHTAPSGPE